MISPTEQSESLQMAIDSLMRYKEHKIPTGSFLEAVLSNDLFKAVGKADQYSRANLFAIVNYIYNEMPGNCWGSREIVNEWLKK